MRLEGQGDSKEAGKGEKTKQSMNTADSCGLEGQRGRSRVGRVRMSRACKEGWEEERKRVKRGGDSRGRKTSLSGRPSVRVREGESEGAPARAAERVQQQ